MSGRVKLVPVVMVLALVAGCRASSDEGAQGDNTTAPDPPAVVMAPEEASSPVPAVKAPPPPPPSEPATVAPLSQEAEPLKQLPVPTVTVRAQPAPYFPLDLPPSDVSASDAPFPREVTEFMVTRDGCDHFRGEEAYDAERRAYIAENIAELCHGSDATLAQLRRRYANNPAVTDALRGYADRIEGGRGD